MGHLHVGRCLSQGLAQAQALGCLWQTSNVASAAETTITKPATVDYPTPTPPGIANYKNCNFTWICFDLCAF